MTFQKFPLASQNRFPKQKSSNYTAKKIIPEKLFQASHLIPNLGNNYSHLSLALL